MKTIGSLVALVALLGACSAPADPTGGGSASLSNAAPPHTASDLLASNARPIVIGHEGAGENFGADTTKPINDTVDSVRLAYQQGAAAVAPVLEQHERAAARLADGVARIFGGNWHRRRRSHHGGSL